MTAGAERIAVQAAVLAALRATGAQDPVWPGTTLGELALDDAARAAVAADVMRALRVDLAPADFAAAPTAGALIDVLEERADRAGPVRRPAVA